MKTQEEEEEEEEEKSNVVDPPAQGRQQRVYYRIAMVCDFFHPRLGGVENHIWSLSQQLLQQGHSVIVITHAYRTTTSTSTITGGNKNNNNDYQGVKYLQGSKNNHKPLKVYYCPILPLVDQDALPTFTATFPLLRWILKRERIDIVHAHQATSTMANESIAYAHLLGRGRRSLASVYTDHSLFGFDDVAGVVLNRVLQTTLSTVNAVICVSHACRDNFLLRTRLPLPENRVHVIPNAIDPTQFTPDPKQRRPNTGRIQVVVVSRLVYRKGADLLAGVIPELCRRLPNVDFLIGGDGSKLLLLREMVERERLEDRVIFLGAISSPEHVRNVLVQGHVFLNCSLTESFCIAILEAACAGLVVVSTNVGGIPEVLPPHMIRLADPNVPAMVEQLHAAIVQQQQQQPETTTTTTTTTPLDPWQMHTTVSSLYSWERVALETIRVYDSAVQTCSQEELSSTTTGSRGGDWIQRRGQRLIQHVYTYYCAVDGGIAGLVTAFIAIVLHIWLCVVEYWQPENAIDVVVPEEEEEENLETRSSSSCPNEKNGTQQQEQHNTLTTSNNDHSSNHHQRNH